MFKGIFPQLFLALILGVCSSLNGIQAEVKKSVQQNIDSTQLDGKEPSAPFTDGGDFALLWHPYYEAARGVVGCYERKGAQFLPLHYDEEGLCEGYDENGFPLRDIWTYPSKNETIQMFVEKYYSYGMDPGTGRYEGYVVFKNEWNQVCTFGMEVDYSGEDILVDLSKTIQCEDKKELQ